MVRFLLAVPEIGPSAVRGVATHSCHFAGSFDDQSDPHRCRCCGGLSWCHCQHSRDARDSVLVCLPIVLRWRRVVPTAQGLRPTANTRRTGDCVPLGPGGYARRSSAASCVENSSMSLAESFASSGGSTVHRSQSKHWVLALQHVQVGRRPHVGRQPAVDKHFGMRLRLGNVVHVILASRNFPCHCGYQPVGASRHVSCPTGTVNATRIVRTLMNSARLSPPCPTNLPENERAGH